MTSMLTPVLALIVLTLIVWIWMYATRIPAMQGAKIDPQTAAHPGSLDVLAVVRAPRGRQLQPSAGTADDLLCAGVLIVLAGHTDRAHMSIWPGPMSDCASCTRLSSARSIS